MDYRRLSGLIVMIITLLAMAGRAEAQKDAPRDCVLQPDMATHHAPPYPATAPKLSDSFTSLWATIGADGTALDVAVDTSSGSAILDEAARTYVQQNWKWKASAPECGSVPTRTRLIIGWNSDPAH